MGQYEIIIKGHFKKKIGAHLGLEQELLPDGKTKLTGALPDQSALFGILTRLYDLGITLIRLEKK